ncbi:deoxynucleoside triphosphate triphosphohydrolase SAMHD1-like [Physella acuta]|uniref:deoxynucleoside triphosphate triphosphohydrolase SAMHD1-like n=1 Tax=Physella acuta TaxID=109671 RepID=UPI0027DE3E0E|nr:deoxynucleoside triphosphate triphosphohydrolase SAMHD1-like [Physella acuta]XP_059152282.1 deoxynucleoside triphosphate triphosphohydrolase SAMHD1-like [Physella acuta]XP_059152283.1 deoxynucleoside triphosphate triphosphohydrolase SAMHD1-like [Physella acuta]
MATHYRQSSSLSSQKTAEEKIPELKGILEELKQSGKLSKRFRNATEKYLQELNEIECKTPLETSEEETDEVNYGLDYNTIKIIHDWKNEKNRKESVDEWLQKCGVSQETVNILRDEEIEEEHIPDLTMASLMKKGVSYSECLKLQAIFEEYQSTDIKLPKNEGLDPESSAGECESLVNKSRVMKVYNDPIHGHIEVNPACQAIIDTPIFQRLRFIKQLGMVYYVYPGAGHNRFEHSLGVYHLAGQFVRNLRQNQPELDITENDILCVEIAALCHDLGHGPFSHVFDNLFLTAIAEEKKKKEKDILQRKLNEVNKQIAKSEEKGNEKTVLHEELEVFKKRIQKMEAEEIVTKDLHEKLDSMKTVLKAAIPNRSVEQDQLLTEQKKLNTLLETLKEVHITKHDKNAVEQFDHLCEYVAFEKYGLTEEDKLFIKEMIGGPLEITGTQAWPYVGRQENKAFLYEIVCNKRNSNDANIWDYLARDCHHLGFYNNFDYSRFMKFARVLDEDGELQICIRDKEIANLYNMFYTRYTLHKYAYQHKVNRGLEIMVTDALKLANDVVTFDGKTRKKLPISECINDMVAFTQLNDNILFKILYFKGESKEQTANLKKAKKLIERIFKRDLYTCVWESLPLSPKSFQSKTEPIESLEKWLKPLVDKNEISADGFMIKLTNFDFGMKEENPVERLKVYSKKSPNKARFFTKAESSIIMGPAKFNEIILRVYLVNHDEQKSKKLQDQCILWYDDWTTKQLASLQDEKISDFRSTLESVLKGNQETLKQLAAAFYKNN